jgi:beta-glucanase (GH16 family)
MKFTAAACALLASTASAANLRGLEGENAVAGGWYELDAGLNQHPENIVVDGQKFTMTVMPDANSCKLSSTQTFTEGRFEIKLKSASKMPGVITAIYLASGDGRKGDEALGDQDEIDFEFKGSEPMQVQTNVFLSGEESLKVIELAKDTSAEAMTYAIEWDAANINFFVDQENVRTVATGRALKPLKLSISVWTTMGGWPGLIKWAGETNWGAANGPVAAEFEVISLPNM